MPLTQQEDIEGHDESYFASFTDLLVGVLFLFIILLMVFASKFDQQTEQMQEAEKSITGMIESRNTVLQEIERTLKAEGVEVSIDLEQGILRLPESVLFDHGKDNLNPDGVVALEKLAPILREYLPCLAGAQALKAVPENKCDLLNLRNRDGLETVLIEGHTDKSAGADGTYDNWGLSARRSINVFKKLTGAEPILDSDLRNARNVPILAVSGYEARRPVSDDDFRKNRRIDLRFVMRSPTPEDVQRLRNVVSGQE